MSEYRGRHQPDPDGPQMHEAGLAFPDLYEHPRYYVTHGPEDAESLRAISVARSNPDAMIKIYRSAPRGVTQINPGDWVTPSKHYATQHGLHPYDPEQDMPVISMIVRAKELRTEGNSIHEWGWFPEHANKGTSPAWPE